MSVIALNAMGTDRGPETMVRAAHMAAAEGIDVILVGDQNILQPLTELPIAHSPVTIGMKEQPLAGYRRHRDSSVRVAAGLVKSGEADAMVDCGNTGVALFTATMLLERFEGLERATIAARIPRIAPDGTIKFSSLLDAGANIDPNPNMMTQWGVLGSLYTSLAFDIDDPRVGLVSNGEEDSKGTELVVATNAMLHELGSGDKINFVGNVQGGGVFDDSADVIVTDGFTGNIMLKEGEVLARMIFDGLTAIIKTTNLRTQLAGKLLRPHLRPVKVAMDGRKTGGSLLLGVKKPCIIGHGSSDEVAVLNALRRANETVDNELVGRLERSYVSVLAA